MKKKLTKNTHAPVKLNSLKNDCNDEERKKLFANFKSFGSHLPLVSQKIPLEN